MSIGAGILIAPIFVQLDMRIVGGLRVTSTTTAAFILTVAITTVPSFSAAQTPESPAAAPAPQSAQSAPQHLGEAERLLAGAQQDSLKKDAKKKLAQLREHFAELVKAYQANGEPFVPPAVETEADEKPGKENTRPANWKMLFSEVESDLAGIIGGGSSQPASATPAAGTIAADAGDNGIKDLTPDVRRQFEQFRLELELFFAAMTMNVGSGNLP